MQIEEQLLAESIRNTIHEADQAVTKVFHLLEASTPENIEDDHGNTLAGAKEVLRFYVDKVFRDTSILAERLGLPLYHAEITKFREEFDDLADVDPTPDDVIYYSPPLHKARALFNSLMTMTNGRSVTGLGVFETILQSTPAIISAAKIEPENEAQVRAQIRSILGFAFHDVVREIPIPKNIKTYRPDIGVRSLMAAAEYKFIDSALEAKKALDDIYTDMRGYTGSPEWRSFYAILYMTGPYYAQKQIDEEFRLVKADLSWTPFVVVGPGKRKPKK